MKHKIWKRLFLHTAAIIVSFCVLISFANGTMLRSFFIWREKQSMVEGAEKIKQIDISDRSSALESLRDIEDRYSTTINIYYGTVRIYSTLRQSGNSRPGMTGFDMLFNMPEKFDISESESRDGGVFAIASERDSGSEYIIYTCSDTVGGKEMTIELMVQKSLIEDSADTASSFMFIVSCICLIAALVWSILFSRRFAKPIAQMNEIAVDMSHLDFSRKLIPSSDDEIGQLARSINELSASLDKALRELQEKNARLENEIEAERRLDSMRKGFVANVSHELKTPISIIGGYAEGLCSGVGADKQKKYCQVIKEETERMNKLVMNLLELSRYESGMEPNYTDFDLSASIVDLMDRNSSQIEKKGVSVELDIPESQQVRADMMFIEQALQNYISNAVSHVNEGGLIRVSAEPYGQNVRAVVYNSGSHVAEEDLENIWQSFYRADKSHNRSAGRYGLGLSIVKAIMMMHKRDFGVFNTDSGVCFWLELERADGRPKDLPDRICQPPEQN
jgi:two-component system sensor histidine kinase VanS